MSRSAHMALYACTFVLVPFAQLVARPWLRRRCGGAIPRASAPVAIAMILASALIGEGAGRALSSVPAGIVVFGLALYALAAAGALWTQRRRARQAASKRAPAG